MSDMLNERFADLIKGQSIVLESSDPMPTVKASVIPGEGSEPSQISDVQTAKAGGKDPMPTVQPSVAIGQSSPTDLGGSTTTPHPHDEDGEENPGAKASAPVGSKAVQSDGTAQTSNIHDAGDQGKTPTIGTDVAYGTSVGSSVTYPIKPSFEELDMSDDVAALTEGTELSEEFADKAKTIFESAVKSRLKEEYTKLEEHFEARLQEELEKVKTDLSEEVNGLVNYGVNRWIESNQVAIDRGLKNEITEDFILGLKNLFKEHYISIPDEKIDVVEGMAEELREMETRLNEQIERNVDLNNRLSENQRVIILNKVSEGLADTQKDKLSSLAEGIKFESVEKFTHAVNTLKESYFPNTISKASEVVNDSPTEESLSVSPVMEQYAKAISRWK